MQALRSGCITTLLLCALSSHAATLELRVSLTTGEVFIENTGVETVIFDGYSIDSASGSLIPAGWLSVTDNYDVGPEPEADGSVDPLSEWTELSSTTGSLAEASLTELSGMVGAGESIDLGLVWSTAGAGDLTFDYLAGQDQFSSTPVYFLEADVDQNNIVSASDYTILRDTLSNPAAEESADINGDGVIDNADLVLWQAQFGDTNPFPLALATPAVVATAFSVPEPSTLATGMLTLLSITTRRRR